MCAGLVQMANWSFGKFSTALLMVTGGLSSSISRDTGVGLGVDAASAGVGEACADAAFPSCAAIPLFAGDAASLLCCAMTAGAVRRRNTARVRSENGICLVYGKRL